jgi:hypothetical protein
MADDYNQGLPATFRRPETQGSYPTGGDLPGTYKAFDTTSGKYGDVPTAGPDIGSSQAVQRGYQNRNPVIPNSGDSGSGIVSSAAASTGAPSTPSAAPATPVSDAAQYYGSEGAPPGSAGGTGSLKIDPLGAINNFFRPNSVSAQSYRTEQGIVAPSARVPRNFSDLPQADYSNEGRQPEVGTATAAANAASNFDQLPAGITQTGKNEYTGVGGPEPIVHPDIIGDTARANAIGAANQETSYIQGQRFANQQQAGVDLQRAQGEARVANFLRNNAADVVLGGVVDRSRAARGYGAAADAATARLNQAQQTLTGANNALAAPSGRNYVQEAATQEASRLAGQQAQIAGSEAQQKAQASQLQLQHQQRLNDLSSKLIGTADPKQRAALQQAILTLMGKNEIGRYDAKVAEGETYFDPANPTVPLKRPPTLIITDKYGQEPPHVQQLSQSSLGAAPGGPKAAPAVGEVRGGFRFKGGEPSNPNSWEKV